MACCSEPLEECMQRVHQRVMGNCMALLLCVTTSISCSKALFFTVVLSMLEGMHNCAAKSFIFLRGGDFFTTSIISSFRLAENDCTILRMTAYGL